MKRSEVFKLMQKVEDPQNDADKILSNLHYTHFFLMDHYKKALIEYNLTSAQANVLGIIAYFAPKTASLEEIKEMVLEPNSDVSRTVTRLTDKGFAEKVINPDNRRKVSIAITSKGLKMMKKIDSDKTFKKFTSTLSKHEAKTFVNILEKLRKTCS
jgi:DNA-binding MarR family transcriptional regulator